MTTPQDGKPGAKSTPVRTGPDQAVTDVDGGAVVTPPSTDQRPVAQPDPPPADESLDQQIAGAEAKLAALRAERDGGGQPSARLKVEPPHFSVTYGGITVGSDFTDVPAHMVPALMAAAADAHATITQEG